MVTQTQYSYIIKEIIGILPQIKSNAPPLGYMPTHALLHHTPK